MSRSIKKGPFCAPELLKRVDEMNQTGEKKVLKTWSRASTIFPSFVGHTFAVHDGRKHQARARLRDRGHGGPQAGRVRPHPHLPRPRRQQDR